MAEKLYQKIVAEELLAAEVARHGNGILFTRDARNVETVFGVVGPGNYIPRFVEAWESLIDPGTTLRYLPAGNRKDILIAECPE